MPALLTQRFATHDDFLAWVDARPGEERYEVVEGYPVMSPGAGFAHQLCQSRLLRLLQDACPSDHVALAGPFDWVLWELPALQVREPDLLVMRRPDDPRTRRLEAPPLLAVEILSPSSMETDLFTKRREYARAGLEHYWVIDPDQPQVAVFRRAADDMTLLVTAVADERLELAEPFPISFSPSELLA